MLSGYYSSQQGGQNYFGQFNLNSWANRDNLLPPVNGVPQPDQTVLQDSLSRVDNFVARLCSVYNYASPLPTSIPDFPRLVDLCNMLLGLYLYTSRGMQDSGNEWDGKMADLRRELLGFINSKGVKVVGEIEAMFVDGFNGAPRANMQSSCPEVIISPVFAPYGSSTSYPLPANQIPTVP